MTRYNKRDIRAADMLALIFVGLGIALLVFAVMPLFGGGEGLEGGKGLKGFEGGGAAEANPGLWIAAGMFVILGLAMHLKVMQLVRNQGHEPEDYPGVPE